MFYISAKLCIVETNISSLCLCRPYETFAMMGITNLWGVHENILGYGEFVEIVALR